MSFFLFLCFLLSLSSSSLYIKNVSCVEVLLNETIDEPPGFTPTLLEGNLTAWQELLDVCLNDTSCAEIYGQSVTESLQTFIHLVIIVGGLKSDPLVLQDALQESIYGKTLQEIANTITVLQLEVAMLKSNMVCGINEKPRLSKGNIGTIECQPLPGRRQSDTTNITALSIFIIVAAFIVLCIVVIQGAYNVWTRSRMSVKKSSISSSVK
jgi:hypothetical protein